MGHRDIDANHDDPGFDVIDYCETVFGKVNVYLDPLTESALSPSDVIFALNNLDWDEFSDWSVYKTR
jgi:hypothetical protein